MAASVPLLFAAAACGASDGESSEGGPGRAEAESENTSKGQMGGSGIRKNRANLFLQKETLANELGTRNGGFNLFTVECSPKKVTVKTGDEVSAVFTVGSQEVVFHLQGKEFTRTTSEQIRRSSGEVRWGAGSSFEVGMLTVILNNDYRATFSGSVTCP
ncbi:hypothetical protein E1287_01935 [Actinomadura sp. KC06]|uniref:hypothetical protein n=1 Tax=Actinomadura sp. KC06 TaxID=2530369 RepID=UPI0010515E36|nr:hypothetical protein [Actinomadura sp. KC06]TDD39962.1 hypothetical protein E1287_01935 [Actinomadura sp. KC06]